MVAAAGDKGALEPWIAWACLGWIVVGIALIFWLAQSTVQVNQIEQWEHPEVLTSKARDLLTSWGYDLSDEHATGYVYHDDRPLFWYRQRPKGHRVGYFFLKLTQFIKMAIWILFILLCARLLLRKPALASVATLVVLVSIFASGEVSGLEWFLTGSMMMVVIWCVTRIGFLCLPVLGLARTLLLRTPITTDLSSWYASSGIVAVAIVMLIAIFGFYCSLGGRRILRDPFGSSKA